MSVNSYLTELSTNAILSEKEKDGIQRSIGTLKDRLEYYFDDAISQDFIFGSYSRGTILPRSMDEHSDIDYMIIFSDSSSKPQTYLDRLRRFVEQYYSSSDIAQSNPTIVLSLNHICFELVPAIDTLWSGLRIPAKASAYQDWVDTNPKGFNEELTEANKSHNNLIKPLVRILKYWNACNNYPFESYSLEQNIVGHGFFFRSLIGGGQLKDYFYDYVDSMNVGWFEAKWRQEAVERAKSIVAEAKSLEKQGHPVHAENKIVQLLPLV